jgi:hypothetical protein
MKGLSNLISVTSSSIVTIQSGVLVLFVVCFVFLATRMYGKRDNSITEEIGRRALED